MTTSLSHSADLVRKKNLLQSKLAAFHSLIATIKIAQKIKELKVGIHALTHSLLKIVNRHNVHLDQCISQLVGCGSDKVEDSRE